MIRISAFLAVLIVLGGVGGAGAPVLAQTISGGSGGATACTGLSDAGTACQKNTGTSGATVPLNNGANTFSATQMVNLNAAAAPAPITGTALQVTGADGVTGRVQATAFGAITAFSGARYDGTGASPTQVLSGDQITGVNAYAFGGGVLNGPIASIRTYAAENIDATHWGSKACIATTPIASVTLADVFCMLNDGAATISKSLAIGGAPIGSNVLAVTGASSLAGTTVDASGNVTSAGYVRSGGELRADTGSSIYWLNRAVLKSTADGVILVANNASTSFGRFQLGGTTTSFPAIKRNGTAINIRLADDSADAAITASTITASASIVTTPHTVAGLPGSPVDGQRDFVTDATACTFAATPTGGGSTHCPVYYDSGAVGWKEG